MDLRFEWQSAGQRFSGSSPNRVGDFVIFADFEPAHYGPAAKRDKMMSGTENG
jgi:hypothetical protein